MSFAARQQRGGAPPPLSPWAPAIHRYQSVGAFTEVIPSPIAGEAGPSQLIIELGGPGGGGSFSPYLTRNPPGVSGSGGSGSLGRSVFALTPANWGQTFNVSIVAGAAGGDGSVNFNGRSAGACVITNGSFSVGVNMQAGGGQGGTWNPGAGGPGGVSSGANQANISGNTGQGNTSYPTPSRGGAPVAGNWISSGAGGNASVVANGNGSPGQAGAAAFSYT